MRLSDEDYNTCVKKAVPDNHHTWPTNRDVASAAYARGVERARNTPDAATRAVIERLVEALEQYAPRDRAVTQDLIAGARYCTSRTHLLNCKVISHDA